MFFLHDKANDWRTIRRLSNSETHISSQSIILPGQGIDFLYGLAEDIDKLFGNSEKCISFLVIPHSMQNPEDHKN